MSAARPDVVALSNSEQQRETLVIMLDSDFDVTPLPAPPAAQVAPAAQAVVLSADPWDGETLMRVSRCWPSAAIVLVDAPEVASAALPHAARATWADPLGLPEVVAAAAATRVSIADDDLRLALREARLDLGPSLETARVLAALLRVVRRPESVEIATRLLGERLRDLCDRLAWVSAYDEDDDETEPTDLGALLQAAFQERGRQAAERGIEIGCYLHEAFLLPCSAERARALADCLRRLVLEDATPGRVAIEATAAVLHLRQPERRTGATQFPRRVARTLARRLGARWQDDGSSVAVMQEEADAGSFD